MALDISEKQLNAEEGSAEQLSVDQEPKGSDWKPGKAEWLILICLALLSLVVSLDATILVPVLPVR